MQATLNIDDKILTTARDLAARRDVSLDEVVNDLLRTALTPHAVMDAQLGLPVLVVPEGTSAMDLGKFDRALAEGM